MKKIEAIIRPEKLEPVKQALTDAGFPGMHVENVTGRGRQRGIIHSGRGGESYLIDMLPKAKIVVVVPDDKVEQVIQLVLDAARTGHVGDGKIFISTVEDAIRVRTGVRGAEAL